jgi:hypothetical protein
VSNPRQSWCGALALGLVAPLALCALAIAQSPAAAPLPASPKLQQSPQEPAPQAPAAAEPKTPAATQPQAQPAQVAGAENAPASDETTPELDRAVARGLAYLASVQNEDGSFGRGRFSRHVGITALCGIAFMADGHVPGRGRYGENVAKALEYVLRSSEESGLLAVENSTGPMYGHGFGALFLGEVYGMNPQDTRVRDALVRAVQLIVNSQNDEGGWRYNPVPYDADVSVTICQVMAMRSARNAGIKVPKETIDAAVRYVRECQNADGGFRYMRVSGASAWPRSAAGVATLFYAGIYEDDSIARALDYLARTAPPGSGGPMIQPYYFYGHYYAVQAMYLAGGEWWAQWWPGIRDELVRIQSEDGSWVDHQSGNAYATAMALVVAQMPKRYLPIFQR